MKFVCGLLFSLACSLGVMAQQQHFVYIQSESAQPFYVQMDNTIYSSSASGYVILASLADSTYKISIGFPKSDWPQEQYSFTINDNDLGFSLKFISNKWVLSNLQKAGNTVLPESPEGSDTLGTDIRTDAFAMMLSNAVNDPSLKQKATVETKTYTNTAIDSGVATKTDATLLWSTVTKISSKKTAEGTAITYVDVYGDQRDTIKIVLPLVKKVKAAKPKVIPDDEVSEPVAEEVQQPVVKTTLPDKPKEEKFLNMSVTPKATVDSTAKVTKEVMVVKTVDTTASIIPSNNVTPVPEPIKKDTVSIVSKPVMVNSECKNLATQEDFIKLRRKMADQTDDNAMLVVAKKTFRTRCFTTEQIKNMGALFFSDQGRYTFFETAYEVVSDGQNYEVLKNQLTDPAYVARFESMIHH
jgi:uncharacterized protein DUF4476